MHVSQDISLKTYLKFDEYFDLRKYELKKSFLKNIDFNQIFMLINAGVIGKLVEVESADGDIVSITVE